MGKGVSVLRKIKKDGQLLTLVKWDPVTGEAREPIDLAEGALIQSFSPPDGHYVFVYVGTPNAVPDAKNESWLVISVKSGKSLGKVKLRPGGPSAVTVARTCLF